MRPQYSPSSVCAAATRLIWLLGLSFALTPAAAHAQTCKQPVYVIAHRCNDPNDSSGAVDEGVNAIEADFSWGSRAFADNTGHDDEWAVEHDEVFPHSTKLDNWLTYVAVELADANTTLNLIVMDIKDPDGPIDELYKTVRGALGDKVYLILSIGHYKGGVENFDKLKDLVNADERAGVAIDDLPNAIEQWQVQSFFTNLGMKRYWFGDGIAAGAIEPASVENHVNQGIALRDTENDCNSFHGVYTWTYEEKGRIQHYLNKGVNGILVNSQSCNGYANYLNPDLWTPAEAVAYAKNLPNGKFATLGDSPFDLSPEIDCPTDTTVECSTFGGSYASDPQLTSFFNGVNCTSDYCGTTVTNEAPLFFGVGTTTPVKFTGTLNTLCSPSSNCSANVTVLDRTSPLVTCPADIAQDPVSPTGNVVTFSATAADTCDGNAQVVCNHPSGSTFGMGTTTAVSCTATDASKNSVACNFNVKIYTPQEVVENLKAAVQLTGQLNPGQINGLISMLDALLASIEAPNHGSICGQLDGFIAKVSGLISQGNLAAASGQPLINSANNLKQTYNCF